MAVTDRRVLQPRLPAFADLDPDRFGLDYDRPSDTLYWDFYGTPRASVSYPVTDHLLYSVDPETDEVVGVQLDGFLAWMVYEVPLFLELADLIGLEPDEVAAIRARTEPEARTRATLRSLLGSLVATEPLPVGA